jgi:hypothetical protein
MQASRLQLGCSGRATWGAAALRPPRVLTFQRGTPWWSNSTMVLYTWPDWPWRKPEEPMGWNQWT